MFTEDIESKHIEDKMTPIEMYEAVSKESIVLLTVHYIVSVEMESVEPFAMAEALGKHTGPIPKCRNRDKASDGNNYNSNHTSIYIC